MSTLPSPRGVASLGMVRIAWILGCAHWAAGCSDGESPAAGQAAAGATSLLPTTGGREAGGSSNPSMFTSAVVAGAPGGVGGTAPQLQGTDQPQMGGGAGGHAELQAGSGAGSGNESSHSAGAYSQIDATGAIGGVGGFGSQGIGAAGVPSAAGAGGQGVGAAGSAGTSAAACVAGAVNQLNAATPRCLGLTAAEHGCVEPKILLTLTNPYGIVLDNGYAYVTTFETTTGKIVRVPNTGGDSLVIADSETKPFDIAVASGLVFWCTADSTGHVRKAPILGGAVQDLAEGVVSGVGRVQADDDSVYYLTNYNVVMSVPVAGGASKQLSAGPYNSNIVDLALLDDTLYFTNNGLWDSSYSYKQPETATVSMVDVTGTPSRSAIVSRLNWPQFNLAVDPTQVYFNDDKAIYRVNRLTGAFESLVTFGQVKAGSSPIVDLRSDGDFVYFADSSAIYRVPSEGGVVEAITWGWQSITQLAIDATSIAWTDTVGGVVVAMPKSF